MSSTGNPAGPPPGSSLRTAPESSPGSSPHSASTGNPAAPGSPPRRLARSLRRTPGKLTVIAVVLVVLSLSVGLVNTLTAQEKVDSAEEIAEQREPLATAAQELYRALSEADAASASGFLALADEPEQLRQRFEDNISEVGSSLTVAAAGTADAPEAATHVDAIGQQLPVYAALVESARAANRHGADGGVELREVSERMREDLLPAAFQLYRIETDRLLAQQEQSREFPIAAAAASGALLVGLLAAGAYLRRRTNRMINRGIAVATVAILGGLVWSSVAYTLHAEAVEDGQRGGTEQVERLVEARFVALQARADENLMLVAEGEGSAHAEDFTQRFTELVGEDGTGGMLRGAAGIDPAAGGHLQHARDSAEDWLLAHQNVRELAGGGDRSDAVALAIDTAVTDSGAAAFGELDDSLARAISDARTSVTDSVRTASRALNFLPPGLALIGLLAALGVTAGIWERLREYR